MANAHFALDTVISRDEVTTGPTTGPTSPFFASGDDALTQHCVRRMTRIGLPFPQRVRAWALDASSNAPRTNADTRRGWVWAAV